MRASWPTLVAVSLLTLPTLFVGDASRAAVDKALQGVCELAAADAGCPKDAAGKTECTCTIENAATGETKALGGFQTMRVQEPEKPGQPRIDVTHLIVESGGVWESYGMVTQNGSLRSGNAEASYEGAVDKCWCNYGVKDVGPVCVLETTTTFRGTSQELNYYKKAETKLVVLAYAVAGRLNVVPLPSAVAEEVSKLNGGGPVPDAAMVGKVGKRSWKRKIEAREDGYVVVGKATGSHPFVKETSSATGKHSYAELAALDDGFMSIGPIAPEVPEIDLE